MREGQRALACFGPHRSSDEEYFPRQVTVERRVACVPRKIDRSKSASVGGIDASRVSPRFASALSFPCTFARKTAAGGIFRSSLSRKGNQSRLVGS
jgi:hypothetical protein